MTAAAVVTLTPTNNPEARRLIAGPVDPSEAASVAAAELARLARCGFRSSHPREADGATFYVCRHPSSGTELHLAVWYITGEEPKP